MAGRIRGTRPTYDRSGGAVDSSGGEEPPAAGGTRRSAASKRADEIRADDGCSRSQSFGGFRSLRGVAHTFLLDAGNRAFLLWPGGSRHGGSPDRIPGRTWLQGRQRRSGHEHTFRFGCAGQSAAGPCGGSNRRAAGTDGRLCCGGAGFSPGVRRSTCVGAGGVYRGVRNGRGRTGGIAAATGSRILGAETLWRSRCIDRHSGDDRSRDWAGDSGRIFDITGGYAGAFELFILAEAVGALATFVCQSYAQSAGIRAIPAPASA